MRVTKTHSILTEGEVRRNISESLERADRAGDRFLSLDSETDLKGESFNNPLSERPDEILDSDDTPQQ